MNKKGFILENIQVRLSRLASSSRHLDTLPNKKQLEYYETAI